VGDKDWDQPRQGDLGGAHGDLPARPAQPLSRGPRLGRRAQPDARRPDPAQVRPPRTRPAARPTPPPPDPAAPTEVIQGAGHFDGVDFDDSAAEPLPGDLTEVINPQVTDAMAPAPPPAEVVEAVSRPKRRGVGRRVASATGYTVLGLVSLLVLGLTGYAWAQYNTLDTGIHKSNALVSPTEKKSLNGDTNILIMGLDSRLDENGKPLPQNIYDALHAGDNSVGGFNANVLMLLHVPAHGQAVEISIPRDDYVDLPGCPDQTCKEKIKQAYGLARDEAYNKLHAQGVTGATLEQRARDAGRKEEADTVSQFLGGVPIDHFIEITLVSFFQIAQVVQPVTVCVLKTTHDTFSGANFHAGMQQINASQALAYVRQRRDNVQGDFYYNNFNDLDRERRQQAFISSLAFQLRQAGTFANPSKISRILNVAKRNTAIDSGLNLLEFAQEASNLTGGHITFNTLPVADFQNLHGSIGDVNIVDIPIIQARVRQLLGIKPPPVPTGPVPPAARATVDVVNRSGRDKAASQVEHALGAKGFPQGAVGTGSQVGSTVVEYSSANALTAAKAAAALLGGVPVQQSSIAAPGRVRVVLGTNFTLPVALGGTPPARSDATAAGSEAPGSSANAPSPLNGGSIPCVK
jgi:LCP family protein required for cell wall assembly